MTEIPLFEAGANDTLLSASRANQIVRILNALLRMRGENGIKVSFSDANVIIEFTGEVTPGDGGGGGEPAAGAWTLYGEWEDIAFNQDVVVTLTNADAIADGDRAGAYLSLQAVPMGTPEPGTSGAETYWKLLAPYFSDRHVFNTGTKQIDINSDGDGSKPEITLEEIVGGAGAKCLIRCSDLAGKTAEFIETDICEGGVWKKTLVLRTAAY